MSPFKPYTNPLYESVQPEEWTSGLCCIFANALNERFGIPMQAFFIKSDDGFRTLVHAFGRLDDGRIVDGLGIRNEKDMLEPFKEYSQADLAEIHLAAPGEAFRTCIENVSLDELWDLNPEDHQATNAAHLYIDNNPSIFQEILLMEQIAKTATQKDQASISIFEKRC